MKIINNWKQRENRSEHLVINEAVTEEINKRKKIHIMWPKINLPVVLND
jgi:hypothetical protein